MKSTQVRHEPPLFPVPCSASRSGRGREEDEEGGGKRKDGEDLEETRTRERTVNHGRRGIGNPTTLNT